MACLWERMQRLFVCVCLKVYVMFCCFFFLIKIVLYKIAPSFQMIFFLKTHNANRLKCCCNGLTLLLLHAQDRPFGQYCCTVSTIFSYSQVRTRVSYSCHVSFSSYFSDQVKRGYLDFSLWGGMSLSDLFCLRSWMLNVFCTVMLLAFVLHLMRRSRVRDGGNVHLKKKKEKKKNKKSSWRVLFPNSSLYGHLLLDNHWLYVTRLRGGRISSPCLAY